MIWSIINKYKLEFKSYYHQEKSKPMPMAVNENITNFTYPLPGNWEEYIKPVSILTTANGVHATPYLCAGLTRTNAIVISFQICFDSFTPLAKQNQLLSSLQVFTAPSSHCQTRVFPPTVDSNSRQLLNLHGDSWQT